jgi:very-short-patch-repair endonuclease
MRARPRTRTFAKALRRRLSLPEALLWPRLKGRHLEGLHVRKQHPLGPYVLDFYCDEARLCIEIDGQGHGAEDRPERDARRDAWLADHGVHTLRLRAALVLEDMDVALRMIAAAVTDRRLKRPPEDTPLHGDPLRLTAPP